MREETEVPRISRSISLEERIEIIKNTIAELQMRSFELGYSSSNREKRDIRTEIDNAIKALGALEGEIIPVNPNDETLKEISKKLGLIAMSLSMVLGILAWAATYYAVNN